MNSDFKIVVSVFKIIIIGMGTIGNIISFMVFSRKTFRNNSISTYCRALAVSDLFITVELINNVYIFINKTRIYDINELSCKLFYYLSMQYPSIPPWILVIFSIDKMLNMNMSPPNILKSKFFQWFLVLGIFLFHFVLYSELLITLKIDKRLTLDIYICNFGAFDYYGSFIYAQLAETCVIPFLIMIVTSIITIKQLIESRRTLERTCRIGNKQRKHRDMKFAISSLTFNVVFVAFKMPFFISNIIYHEIIFQVAYILFLINCSSNFPIHFATNSVFRRELFAIFKPMNRT